QRRAKYFVGREELLADLHDKLDNRKSIALIHGLGGVGKTQLATEYSYRYGLEYEIIWWIRAEKAASRILEDYVNMAEHLELTACREKDQTSCMRLGRDWPSG